MGLGAPDVGTTLLSLFLSPEGRGGRPALRALLSFLLRRALRGWGGTGTCWRLFPRQTGCSRAALRWGRVPRAGIVGQPGTRRYPGPSRLSRPIPAGAGPGQGAVTWRGHVSGSRAQPPPPPLRER